MARTQQNVDASVTITLNGKEAEDQIKKLETKAEGLRKQLSEARKALNPDYAQINKLNSELKNVQKTLDSVTRQTKKYDDILKNLDSAPINKLRQAQKQLDAEIKKLVPGTEEFIQATRNYSKVTQRLHAVENEYKKIGLQIKMTTETTKGFFGRMAENAQKSIALVTMVFAGFIRTKRRVEEFVTAAAELDDIYSDVMKTTGLLREEVVALDEELYWCSVNDNGNALVCMDLTDLQNPVMVSVISIATCATW